MGQYRPADGCVASSLPGTVPWVLWGVFVVLNGYSKCVFHIILELLVCLCVQPQILYICSMLSTGHILAVFNHSVKACSSIVANIDGFVLGGAKNVVDDHFLAC